MWHTASSTFFLPEMETGKDIRTGVLKHSTKLHAYTRICHRGNASTWPQIRSQTARAMMRYASRQQLDRRFEKLEWTCQFDLVWFNLKLFMHDVFFRIVFFHASFDVHNCLLSWILFFVSTRLNTFPLFNSLLFCWSSEITAMYVSYIKRAQGVIQILVWGRTTL